MGRTRWLHAVDPLSALFPGGFCMHLTSTRSSPAVRPAQPGPAPGGTKRIRRGLGASTAAMAAAVAIFASGCGPFVAIPGAPGCNITPADAFWRADVHALPVH